MVIKAGRRVLTRNDILNNDKFEFVKKQEKQEKTRRIDEILEQMAERSRRKRQGKQAEKKKDDCTQAKIDKLMDERVNAVVASLQAEGRW